MDAPLRRARRRAHGGLSGAYLSVCACRADDGTGAEDFLHAPAVGVVVLRELLPRMRVRGGLPQDAQPPLGRRGRGRRRSGRGAQRAGARFRLHLGAPFVGRLVDVGPAPDHDDDPLVPLCGLPRPAQDGHAPRAPGEPVRGGRHRGLRGRTAGVPVRTAVALHPSRRVRQQVRWA